jgi:hypothetical protein
MLTGCTDGTRRRTHTCWRLAAQVYTLSAETRQVGAVRHVAVCVVAPSWQSHTVCAVQVSP